MVYGVPVRMVTIGGKAPAAQNLMGDAVARLERRNVPHRADHHAMADVVVALPVSSAGLNGSR